MAHPKTLVDDDLKPKIWRWSEEYKYAIPKPDGDHWDIILERNLMKDKFQCDAWKDEVQNLLIFAGLFSSVVTGFVVQLYQELQPDPNAELAQLLARIAAGVDALANNSSLTNSPSGIGNPTPFSPPSLSVQINILWFSSLILSLTTVIIGIVSLQWLREHQRYTEPLTSKQALAIFHLRAASLKKWHVPHILNFLPLLLQAAVVLFFAGLVEFLLSLNRMVAIPAILLMGLSVLFLVATTILPTIQLFAPNLFLLSGDKMPTQCIYKSPQSWIFRRIFLVGIHIPVLIRRYLVHLQWPAPIITASRNLRNLVAGIWRISFDQYHSHNAVAAKLDTGYTQLNWVDLDLSWLRIREEWYLAKIGKTVAEFTETIDPTYDLVHAIVSSANEHSVRQDVFAATYHAYAETCDALIQYSDQTLPVDKFAESAIRTRVNILQSSSPPFDSVYFKREGVSLRVVRDEMLLLFLSSPGVEKNSSSLHQMHKTELVTRMWIYNFYRRTMSMQDTLPDLIYLSSTFARIRGEDVSEMPRPFFEDVATQHYRVLNHVFQQACNTALGTAHPTPGVIGYTALIHYFDYVAWFGPTDSLESNFLYFLETVTTGLLSSLESQGYDKADFLFFCARLYMERISHHIWFADVMQFGSYVLRESILNVLNAMLRYEQQLDKNMYPCMEHLWRAGLHATGDCQDLQLHSVPQATAYQPIPEVLLRFIPYERRPPTPGDIVYDTTQVSYDVVVIGEFGRHTDRLGGEEMIFSVPPRSSVDLDS